MLMPWLWIPGEKPARLAGIPQGSPISPLLANIYMRRFVLGWRKLGWERSLGTRIVTYADDLVILCTAALLAGIDCATLPAIHQEWVAGGNAMMDLRTALAAVPLLLLASGAFAQKQGGVLRVYHNDNPPTASLHEEVTISTLMPFMALFNNVVSYDQTVKRNADDTIVADLAESWSWSPDRVVTAAGPHQDAPGLPRPGQRVIISVQRY